MVVGFQSLHYDIPSVVFRVMTVSEAITNILEEYIASIFIVEAQALRSSRTLVTSVKLEFHNLIFTQSQISYIDIAKL